MVTHQLIRHTMTKRLHNEDAFKLQLRDASSFYVGVHPNHGIENIWFEPEEAR
jgi:hypothetical protein